MVEKTGVKLADITGPLPRASQHYIRCYRKIAKANVECVSRHFTLAHKKLRQFFCHKSCTNGWWGRAATGEGRNRAATGVGGGGAGWAATKGGGV